MKSVQIHSNNVFFFYLSYDISLVYERLEVNSFSVPWAAIRTENQVQVSGSYLWRERYFIFINKRNAF